MIGRRKYDTFVFIKEPVWKKMQGWKGKLLSWADKEILIKAMAQSISMYTMGVFQLPWKLCNELDAMCARFWWGQIGEERKIHWKNWSLIVAQPLLRKGCYWRVGNGASIRVLKDCWLPN